MIICVTDGEGLVFQDQVAESLFSNHRIYCKPVGMTKESRNNSQFTEPPYLIDKYALPHIYKNHLCNLGNAKEQEIQNVLQSKEFRVYQVLIKQYYVLNGRKFGALFLAYKQDPRKTHAQALVFIQGGILTASRMSTIANKACIYVYPDTLQVYQIQPSPQGRQIRSRRPKKKDTDPQDQS